MVGIKGTGMCALAELFHAHGAVVSGSDCAEQFYTDAILKRLNIPYAESFAVEHLPAPLDTLVYSTAYNPDDNVELKEAVRRGVPLLSYPQALGEYSKHADSSGIAGVHGKTTTTALSGIMLDAAQIPAEILAGSAAFDGHSTLIRGSRYFVAETCEYQKNFLLFHPSRIVLTAVESDHQDYYPTYQSIYEAFCEYCRMVPHNGELIYCADDKGACEVVTAVRAERPDIQYIPYGFNAAGPFRIDRYTVENERSLVKIACCPADIRLRIPGKHTARNSAAAFALASVLVEKECGSWTTDRLKDLLNAVEQFKGAKRRSEIVGERDGILFMDDYAHHPTAIRTTLAGLKEWYPRRRIVLSFMSHTYTRTKALFHEFVHAFYDADILILHKIYGSAREQPSFEGVTGKLLYEAIKEQRDNVYYVEEPCDAAALMAGLLRAGDLCVTMGAGDNWKLGDMLLKK
ncbi:putative UDP-N-acetylmuramate--alanine ligase [Pillotina sp. SPG140]